MTELTSITLTRQDLYDRLWSTPAWKLGPELGMSGRGLAKLCAREGIPVPKRGYWAKREYGWKPTQTKLPPSKTHQTQTFTFDLRINRKGGGDEDARPSLPSVSIPESLDGAHSIVLATVKAARRAKPQEDGRLDLQGPGGLSAIVSPTGLDRALRILDGVVQALEAKGCVIRPATNPKEPSAASIGPDSIEFSIEEAVTRTERPLTDWQLRDKAKHPWKYNPPKYDYTPTGLLALRLERTFSGGIRRTWSDGVRQKLDTLLPRAVQAAIDSIDFKKQQRARWEEAARLREEERRQEEARALRRFQERYRSATLSERLGWRRLAMEIREWLVELRRATHSDLDSELIQRWLAWADNYSTKLQAAATQLPAFETEPTWENQRKYNAAGSQAAATPL